MNITQTIAMIPAKIGLFVTKKSLERLGYYEQSVKKSVRKQTRKQTKKVVTKKVTNKTKLVEKTSMTINFGKSNQGRKDWFVTGKTFTANYAGWNTARTKLFLIGSGGMSETQFKKSKELKSLIKELDGFKLGGRIKGF